MARKSGGVNFLTNLKSVLQVLFNNMLQIALFSNFHHNDHVFTLNFNTKLCGGFVYVHLAGLPAGHTALSADADTAITDQNTKTSQRHKYKYKYNQGFKDTKALCCNYRSLRPLCTALSADVSRRSEELIQEE